MKFTQEDIQQIERKGLTLERVTAQIELFKKGIPFTNLVAAATVGNGIRSLTENDTEHYIEMFEDQKDSISIIKFIPASGAATRMFKFLFKFIKDYNPEKETLNAYINKNKSKDLSIFSIGLEKFPFYDMVLERLQKNYPDYDTLNKDTKLFLFVKMMLDPDSLNYGEYPKGLLPFHEYKNKVISTAFEEHLFETVLYSNSSKAKLHFTISDKYKDLFTDEFKRIEKKVEEKTGTSFEIYYSHQKQSTDTIAVTPDNTPFRENDGRLLFRPSGHGALIENLNSLDADLIFIKNIDNVVVFQYKEEVAKYKKVLAGILLELQNKAFNYLDNLEKDRVSDSEIHEIAQFLNEKLNLKISADFKKYSTKYQIEYLKDKLDRPIRVCGMVKNEGEPGGGPFWVKNEKGIISLQIVESAQVDKSIKKQRDILKNSTHFNPVDIVCGVKNHKGEKYNLLDFVDPDTAFITMKTKTGKDIKALELPGLWNGSMANWNTVFVEVPLITFNPVKTVNDLLKPTHQRF